MFLSVRWETQTQVLHLVVEKLKFNLHLSIVLLFAFFFKLSLFVQ